jgi:hypothetical protein
MKNGRRSHLLFSVIDIDTATNKMINTAGYNIAQPVKGKMIDVAINEIPLIH